MNDYCIWRKTVFSEARFKYTRRHDGISKGKKTPIVYFKGKPLEKNKVISQETNIDFNILLY